VSLSAISNTAQSYTPPSNQSGIQAAFQQLASAIGSGDAQGAQKALATLQQNLGQSGDQTSAQSGPQGDLSKLLATLNNDLNSPDGGGVAQAQTDLAAFQKAHGPHHRPSSATSDASTSTDASSDPSNTTWPDSSSSGSNLLDITA